MPAWLYLRGLLLVLITGSRPTYILGHGYPHGVWFYFPVLLLFKSTLGFLGLLALGLLGSALSLAAVAGTLRVMYIQSPPDEARRTTKLPVLSGLSSFGAVAFCVVIAAYGILSSPILGLADQGAEALGLR